MKRQRLDQGVPRMEEWLRYETSWEEGEKTVIVEEPRDDLVSPEPSFTWPAGGVFVQQDVLARLDSGAELSTQVRRYNLHSHGPTILLEIQRANARDAQSILRFVNRWGLLGVGIPGDEEYPFDGVRLTGRRLLDIQAAIRAVHAIKRAGVSRAEREEFAKKWNDRNLWGSVKLEVQAASDGLRAVSRAHTFLDALKVELWLEATEGRRYRPCPECKALFIPGRTNQRYCCHQCANRPTVRKWKKAQRRKRGRIRQ
jgi:hypothetical protein